MPANFRPLPADATTEQLLHALHEQAAAYATIAASYTQNWPTLLEAIQEIRAELQTSRAERRTLDSNIENVRSKVVLLELDVRGVTDRVSLLESQTAHATEVAALPPMRVETPSSNDLARHLSADVIEGVRAYERNPSTPAGRPSDDALATIVEERASARLAVLKAAYLQQREDDRIAATKLDENLARQIRLRTWITGLAIVAAIIGTLAAHFAK